MASSQGFPGPTPESATSETIETVNTAIQEFYKMLVLLSNTLALYEAEDKFNRTEIDRVNNSFFYVFNEYKKVKRRWRKAHKVIRQLHAKLEKSTHERNAALERLHRNEDFATGEISKKSNWAAQLRRDLDRLLMSSDDD